MVSRWAGAPRVSSVAVKRVTLRREREEEAEPATNTSSRVPIRPFSDGNFVWPTIDEMRAAQQRHIVERPQGLSRRDDGLLCSNGRIWIAADESSLLKRLLVISHCGAQGHRGRAALMNVMNRRFFVRNLSAMVKTFLADCLMCQYVKGGKVVNRPWGETFRCDERNGALHWDFVHLGESYDSYKYLLVLKDDATHFCELVPCALPTAGVAAEAILDWHSRYGAPKVWISDQGTHFKNRVVAEVARRLDSNQRFTVAYCPWINGSILRLNRDIVQVLRAMCLEGKVDIRDWTHFVPVVQASFNHTPVPSLANKAPVELFCVLPAASPLDFGLDSDTGDFVTIDLTSGDLERKLSALRTRVQEMHKKVQTARSEQTKRNQKMQKGARLVNFDVGDYVLRSRVDQNHNDKLLVTWIGPYQVVGTDEHSFRVQHLVTGAESDVHASRLKFYADESFEVTEEIREHVAAQGIILTVAELKDHRWNSAKRCYEILVGWKGLEPIEDSWESLKSLYKDIPVMVKPFVTKAADAKLRAALEQP